MQVERLSRMFVLGLVTLISPLLALPVSAHSSSTSSSRTPIIIDTDIFADVDDIGALAIANVLHNCGLADLKGVVINSHSRYGALAVSAINTYFGNADIPIAALRPLTDDQYVDAGPQWSTAEYAAKTAMNFPRSLDNASDTKEPLELYREILEAASDHSITIISIGILTNLAALLHTRCDKSLVTHKVSKLVIMGGEYPRGREFNFGFDLSSTRTVLEQWPRSIPVTYSGFELGLNILSGSRLRDHAPFDSPVRAAYEWYVGRCSTTRESWDPITVLYGVLGLGGFETHLGLKAPLEYANQHGYNSLTDGNGEPGTNVWVNDSTVTNQRWLKLADGVSNGSFAWMLDEFYIHRPVDKTCFR